MTAGTREETWRLRGGFGILVMGCFEADDRHGNGSGSKVGDTTTTNTASILNHSLPATIAEASTPNTYPSPLPSTTRRLSV